MNDISTTAVDGLANAPISFTFCFSICISRFFSLNFFFCFFFSSFRVLRFMFVFVQMRNYPFLHAMHCKKNGRKKFSAISIDDDRRPSIEACFDRNLLNCDWITAQSLLYTSTVYTTHSFTVYTCLYLIKTKPQCDFHHFLDIAYAYTP